MIDRQQRNRDFSILFLVMIITGAGNTALQSVLPAIGRTMHVPDSVIATVFSVSALIWVFSAPYWARRSDRQGRKRMVLIGSTGFTVSIFMVGILLFAGLSGRVSPIFAVLAVIASRMIFGLFGSAAPPAAQAIVVLQTPLKERTKALSLLSSAFGLGTLLGLALAPWLVLPVVGLAGPAFAFGLFGATTLALVYRFLSEDSSGGRGSATAKGANVSYPSIGGAPAGASVNAVTAVSVEDTLTYSDPRIAPWMLTGAVVGHAQALTGATMGFLVIDRLGLPATAIATQQAIGLALMCGAGAALLVQWGVIPTLDMKPRTMMLVGLALSAVGLLANAYATSLYGIATSYALSSAGFGFTRPAFTSGSSLAVGRRLQGLVAGRVTSINGSSYVLGPTIGVLLYGIDGALPFLTAAVILCALIPYAAKRCIVVED
jgi:MFS family permease